MDKTGPYKTPYYIFSTEELEKNVKKFETIRANGGELLYAVKANNFPTLIKRFVEEDYGFDVASKEELLYVKKLGADMKKVSFSSPTKLEEDIKIAAKLGVKYYSFDTEEEILKIMKYVERPKLFARMAVMNKSSQHELSGIFGMTESYYLSLVKKARKNRWPIVGLTFHVGSQNTSISSWQKALEYMGRLIDLSKGMGVDISYLNMGGGIPAPYENNSKSYDFFIEKIAKQIHKFKKKKNLKKIFIEPGRALCANTMTMFTKIVNIKDYKRPPILVTELSVYQGFIEPLEKLEYPVLHYATKDFKNGEVKRKKYKVCGISCAGTDIIKAQCLLPADIKIGDVLIIPLAGAYTFVFEKFQMKDFPKIYIE